MFILFDFIYLFKFGRNSIKYHFLVIIHFEADLRETFVRSLNPVIFNECNLHDEQ